MSVGARGQRYRLGVLEGDGIGPEIVPAATRVVDAALARTAGAVEWVPLPIGWTAIREYGAHTPPSTIRVLAELDGWLLGPHDSAAYPEPHRSQLNPSGTLRKHFDLFANIRPARGVPGAKAVAPDADLVIVRENTEGFYADRNTYAGTGEFMPSPEVAIAMGVFTRPRIERIARVAFDLARRRRRHVTIVHKANVLQLSSGLFRDVCRRVAGDYPDVEVDDQHVDAMTVHLVRRAADFDVIVTENMFGDILSDLAGELAGSLGLAASLNASHDTAMAQAAHGSAPDIAGQDVANPVSMMLSAALLLGWLGDRHADLEAAATARLIERAVADTIAAGVRTRDLGGTESTSSFAAAVVDRVSRAEPWRSRADEEQGGSAMADVVVSPPLVLRQAEIQPFDRGTGVRTLPYVGKWDAEGNKVTTGITEFPAGAGIPLHTHNVEESVLILEGQATAVLGEDSFDLEPGDATWAPAGVPHRFANRGKRPMRIYWVYGGRQVTRTICATGETVEHLSEQDRGAEVTP
jgi:3-isopropylmalate dehydrogenase